MASTEGNWKLYFGGLWLWFIMVNLAYIPGISEFLIRGKDSAYSTLSAFQPMLKTKQVNMAAIRQGTKELIMKKKGP